MTRAQEYLAEARALIDKVDFSKLVRFSPSGNTYTLSNGKLTGERLFDTDELEIVYVSIVTGTIVPAHTHDETEVFICVDGKIKVQMSNAEHVLEPGDTLTVFPNFPHSVEAFIDSVFIVIRIPSSKLGRPQNG